MRAAGAWAAMLLAACSATSGAQEQTTDELRPELLAGTQLVSVTFDRDHPQPGTTRSLPTDDVFAPTAAIGWSAGSELGRMVFRVGYVESDHDVDGGGAVRVRQGTLQALIEQPLFGGERARLDFLFGLGTGWLDADFRGAVPFATDRDADGAIGMFCGGLQCALFDRVLVDALGSWGGFGVPGETGGEIAGLQIGVAVRF